MDDPTKRFSTRVDTYVKYRPGYPPDVLRTLIEDCELLATSPVADIGSGTGILTKILLNNGNPVFAVEPNPEMRAAAEALLRGYSNFSSIAGRAEATGLVDQSVGFVTAGQAFHWFDCKVARSEFRRILHPDGWAVLVWNQRETETTPFLRAYEALLARFGTDYERVDHVRRITDQVLHEFYGAKYESRSFPNEQDLDFEGAKGRLFSSSYTPEPGHPHFGPMLSELRAIFDEHAVHGRTRFLYTTRMYYGRLTKIR
jgi:SAM-dependent methyltransferase